MKWLTCQEVTELFSESLDRSLPLGQRLSLRVHFSICKWCARYKQQLLFIRHAVRSHPDELVSGDQPVPPTLTPETRERLKRAIRQQRTH
ncbi:MAG TPA: zf-HC2 domain-containing protein [Nitrospiraceae bacterium]|jgi:hypothetical protein